MFSSLRKITAPALPPVMVHREFLVQQLNEAIVGSRLAANVRPYKLILLEAPAGYGKTTLLAEFARQKFLPCCWYLFDHHDNEPLIFLRTLLASLRQCFPSFGEALVPLLSESAASSAGSGYPREILEALVEALTRELSERFALLFCQYHEVNESRAITPLVDYLVNHMPEHGVLVLESREVPELDFASLLAEHAMLGIGRDSLRFSAQEICELARLQGSRILSEEEARQLAINFDGWITGLLLGTRLGGMEFLQRARNAPLSRQGQEVPIHTQALFSYVVNEIFKRHQDMYSFLKEAVILREMRPNLCAELLDLTIDQASQRLRALEHHGLFVTHSEEGTELIYLCHPVLRDLLYEELRQQAPEQFVRLHQRATELLRAENRYEQAIYHALEAGMDEVAAQLIDASAQGMIEQGHTETLLHWISAFPEATTSRYPRLLLVQVNIYLRNGELDQALPLLERIASLLNHPSPQLASPGELPLLRAELAIAQGYALCLQGAYQQARQLCQQVLAQLPADEVALKALAHSYLGTCAEFLGDPSAEIAHYQKALQLWGRHTVSYLTAGAHSLLATAYRRLGHFALAEHHSARATACWGQLHDTRGMVNHLIGRAYLSWDQGKLEEAERLLQEGLELSKRPLRLPRLQGYVLVSLGEFYQEQGLYDRSLTVAEEGLALARDLGDVSLLNDALLILALTYLYIGDAATASLLLSEIQVREQAGGAAGYPVEQTKRDLALGTVLLHRHRYAEALPLLETAEAAWRAIGFKREQLQALVRLSACFLGQKQWSELFQQLAVVEEILTTFDSYEQRVRTELRVLPRLQQAIERRPECATLRALLRWASGEPMQEEQEQAQQEDETETTLTAPAPLSAAFSTPIAAPRLKIIALGEPAVLLDGQPITRWRMARSMELCFYLLDCARPMRKEQILTALWEEVDEQTMQTFYSTIHYLRKALGGESTIVSRAGVYRLDLTSVYGQNGVWYDVAAFEEHYAHGKQALIEGKQELGRAAFENMVELYQGDYVQSFYNDWCGLRRDELRRMYLDAHRHLAQLAWQRGEIEECATHWQQMLAVDPCLEQAHYGLMRCYIRQGRRGVAIRQYQRCKETLQQELNTTPGTAIENLYRRLSGHSQTEVSLP